MANVPVTGNYPAVEFQPTETSSVYHTDQEFTDGSGNSHMYRTYNAQYDGIIWTTLPAGPSEAYATVQDPDGSIHYYSNFNPATSTFESTWTSWFGSGNNAVYNAVDYGMTESDDGTLNTPALQAAIAAAIADPDHTGATVHIPAGTYKLKGTITISGGSGLGLLITGASGGTTLSQKANEDMFQVNTWAGGTGVRFKDLYLQYGVGAGMNGNTAVNVNTSGNSAENITCERVYFDNCPTAFATEANALQCGLLDCTIDYHNGGLMNQVAVSLNGNETFVHGCVIRQPGGNSPSGCTGIQVNGPVPCFITDTHVSDFYTGIQIVGGTYEAFFANLRVDAYNTAVEIAPNTDTGTIYDVHFSNCTLSLADSSIKQSSGVTIGTAGGGNSNVAGIYFDNCAVQGFANAGLEIDGGQNIVVTGGQYASNGQNPTAAAYIGAGIAITGGVDITITGADCSGISYLWQNQINTGTSTPQPYGITVNNDASHVTIVGCNATGNATSGIVIVNEAESFPSNIFVRGCDCSGYSSYNTAVYVKPGETNVEVTDCAGYNDQGPNAVLQSTIPPPSNPISNVSFGYYGPIAFYVKGAGNVTIDGVNTNLTDGGYTLGPGETASIAGTASHFLAVGK
jgi:hypothetical protein